MCFPLCVCACKISPFIYISGYEDVAETDMNTRQKDGIGCMGSTPDFIQPPLLPPRNDQKCSQTNRNDQNDNNTKIRVVAEVYRPQVSSVTNGERQNTMTVCDKSMDNGGYETYDPNPTAPGSTPCPNNSKDEIPENETDHTNWTEGAPRCGFEKRNHRVNLKGNEDNKFMVLNLDECKISMDTDAILDDKVILPNTSRPTVVNACCDKKDSIFNNADTDSTFSRSVDEGAYDKCITKTEAPECASCPRNNGKPIPMTILTVRPRPTCSGYEHRNSKTTEPTKDSLRGYETLNPETMEPMPRRSIANSHICNINASVSFQNTAKKTKTGGTRHHLNTNLVVGGCTKAIDSESTETPGNCQDTLHSTEHGHRPQKKTNAQQECQQITSARRESGKSNIDTMEPSIKSTCVGDNRRTI